MNRSERTHEELKRQLELLGVTDTEKEEAEITSKNFVDMEEVNIASLQSSNLEENKNQLDS